MSSSSLWQCSNCRLHNYSDTSRCVACFKPNPNVTKKLENSRKESTVRQEKSNEESKRETENENDKLDEFEESDEKNEFDYYDEMRSFNQHEDMPPQNMIDDFRKQMQNMDLSGLFGFTKKSENSNDKSDEKNENENNKDNQNEQEYEDNETQLLEKLEFGEKLKMKEIELTSKKSSQIKIEYSIINENNMKSSQWPILFFIHGLMDTMKSWNVLMQQMMSYQGCMISINLLPFLSLKSKSNDKEDETKGEKGESQLESKSFDLNQILINCVSFLDELKIDKCIWIGHNIGSFICQMAAINESDRVSKIILIGTSHCTPLHYQNDYLSKLKEKLLSFDQKKQQDDNDKEMIEFLLKERGLWQDYQNKKLDNEMIDEMMNDTLKYVSNNGNNDNRSKIIEMIDSMIEFDSSTFLEYIECRCTIFVSKYDSIFDDKTQSHASTVNKKIEKSTLVPMGAADTAAGHYLHWYKHIAQKMRLIIWDFARQR